MTPRSDEQSDEQSGKHNSSSPSSSSTSNTKLLLRRQYDTWRSTAPTKPAPRTTVSPSHIARLREHGARYKTWKLGLTEDERALIEGCWEREKLYTTTPADCTAGAGAVATEGRKRGAGDDEDDDDAAQQRAARGSKETAAAAVGGAGQLPPPTPICRHWARTGGSCLYGEDCKFRHPPELVAAEEDSGSTTDAAAAIAAVRHPHRSRTRPNRTNSNRAASLRRFLLETYGETRLKRGTGVVEISAGIAGGVSFEFLNLNDVPCTVIEPRGPLNLERRRRMLRKGIYHRMGPLSQKYNSIGFEEIRRRTAAEEEGGDDGGAVVGRAPRHWRLFFETWMFEAGCLDEGNEGRRQRDDRREESFQSRINSSIERAVALGEGGGQGSSSGHEDDGQQLCQCDDAGENRELSDDDDEGACDAAVAVDDDGDSDKSPRSVASQSEAADDEQRQKPPTADEIASTLHNASILIGMHPDQPTEDIVDAALALSKPFAVVPCCVFPKLFPQRRLEGGTPVRSYEQFIEYLRAKDTRIRIKEDLGFGGRSTVLYFDPLVED